MNKAYLIKDRKSELYQTSNGGWSNRGKIWNSIGHIKSSIYRRYTGELEDISRDIVILEVIIQDTGDNTMLLADFVETQRRYKELSTKYGSSFSDLIQRIEKDDQQDVWKWCLLIPVRHQIAGGELLLREIKSRKLKLGSDYRKAQSYGVAVAFKSKEEAMMIRLSLPSEANVISLDIQNFVEDES